MQIAAEARFVIPEEDYKAMSELSLIKTIYRNEKDLYKQVAEFISVGEDLNRTTKYSESALRVASNNGRFDVVKLLLDSGADAGQLRWSAIHYAVVYGTIAELKEAVAAKTAELEEADFWSRTPFLLSILVGDIDKITTLLALGANRDAVGRCGKTVFHYAIQNDDVFTLDWLVKNKFDLSLSDEFGATALLAASSQGRTNCVRYLIEHGVDIFQTDHMPARAIEVATNMEIVQLLVARGDEINDISEEMHSALIGVNEVDNLTVPREVYVANKLRNFGSSNAEEAFNLFWLDMMQSGSSAWEARSKYDDTAGDDEGPVWSYQRYGRTTNILPDGRIVEIAGEHEDHYDPDFCIYNDVVVFESGKKPRIFCYPERDFPPTDFHTATLVDHRIIVIACLGYPDSRRVGLTPVYILNLNTMRVKKLPTSGTGPGWISQHKTNLDGRDLVVTAGEVWEATEGGFNLLANTNQYALNLDSLVWRKL